MKPSGPRSSSEGEPGGQKASATFRTRFGQSVKILSASLPVLARVARWFVVLVLGAVALQVVLEYVQPDVQDWCDNWVEGDPYLRVWVNPEVKVYFPPGDKAYGNTLPGFYLGQADARAAGYRSTNPWGIGFGTSHRPLKTKVDLSPFTGSKLSWLGGATLDLDNKSDWEIKDVTIWIAVESGPRRTYRLTGQAKANSRTVFQIADAESPNGRKWTWGFSKVRGFPP